MALTRKGPPKFDARGRPMSSATPSPTGHVLHWHLRKCAGTSMRLAFVHPVPLRGYYEIHDNFAKFVSVDNDSSGCALCPRLRVVVLREPYEQFMSEVNYFPEDFTDARMQRAFGPSRTFDGGVPSACAAHAALAFPCSRSHGASRRPSARVCPPSLIQSLP